MFLLMKFLFPSIAIQVMKDEQILNIQMEHSHSIINLNVTQQQQKTLIWHFMITMFLIY
jgi:hypothetical protein